MHQARPWHSARPSASILVVYAGTILGLATVIVCAANAVSAGQAVVMAVATGLTLAGGTLGRLFGELLPELRVAWQRGFQQGFEAGQRARTSRVRSREPPLAWLRLLPSVPAEPGTEPGAESAEP